MKMLVKILLLSSVSLLAASSSSEDSADVSSSGSRVKGVRDFSCTEEMLQKRANGGFFPYSFVPSKDSEDGDIVVIEEKKTIRSHSGGDVFFPGILQEDKVTPDGGHALVLHVPIETRKGLVYNKRSIFYNAKGEITSDQCVSPDLQTLEAAVPPVE